MELGKHECQEISSQVTVLQNGRPCPFGTPEAIQSSPNVIYHIDQAGDIAC